MNVKTLFLRRSYYNIYTLTKTERIIIMVGEKYSVVSNFDAVQCQKRCYKKV